jgi:hypothetical protein
MVPNATVQFIHHQYDGHGNFREQFGACQWGSHLPRLPTTLITFAPILKLINKWNADNPSLSSSLIKMSPYLLAIRKYPRVSSFHDFPFTSDLIHLLPPNWMDVYLVSGNTCMPVYTGSSLSSHRWNPSMLRSLVNMRSNNCRRADEKFPKVGPFLALARIIMFLGKDPRTSPELCSSYTGHESLNQLTEISFIAESPRDGRQFFMDYDLYQLLLIMVTVQELTSSSERTRSLFRYNHQSPVLCPTHSSKPIKRVIGVPVFEVTCVICHQSTRSCCSRANQQTKYYKCIQHDHLQGCQRSPVCRYRARAIHTLVV